MSRIDMDNRGAIIRCMLACNTLRIDRDDGASATEYRIEDGHVHTRILKAENPAIATWRRMTAEQLTAVVKSDALVAYWLRRRMGVHRLVRACSADSETKPQFAA